MPLKATKADLPQTATCSAAGCFVHPLPSIDEYVQTNSLKFQRKKRRHGQPQRPSFSSLMRKFTKASLRTCAPKMPFTKSTFSSKDNNRFAFTSSQNHYVVSLKIISKSLNSKRNSYVRPCQIKIANSPLSTSTSHTTTGFPLFNFAIIWASIKCATALPHMLLLEGMLP